jgi:hypothetical protein
VIDKSLHFGQQNFFWVKGVASGETSGDTYEYNFYMNRKGIILISRVDALGTEQLFAVSKGEFATVLADRHNLNYVLPNELSDLRVND